MCVSQTDLIPRKIPLPQFPEGYRPAKHRMENSHRYRVVRFATAVESTFQNDEATGQEIESKVTVVRARVYFDGKSVDELNEFLSRYPGIDTWRAGSAFDVQIYSGGEWKKIYNPPY